MLRRFTLLSAASLLVLGSVRAEVLPTTPPTAPSFAPVKTKAMRPLMGEDVTYDWEDCTSGVTFSGGWTQFSVTGSQTWACANSFGRDETDPTKNTGNSVGANGYDSATKKGAPNEDWLISPAYDLTAYGKPTFSYWSRAKFAGPALTLQASTNYSGSGSPKASGVTWTTITAGTFADPMGTTGSDWTQTSGVDLSAYKSAKTYIAFVYTSTDGTATRYNLDDMELKDAGTLATHTGSKTLIGFYPNPATNSVRFDVPELGNVQLEAFTAEGRLVLKSNGTVAQLNQQLNQSFGSLASGIYMLRVTGTQQVYTGRLVKK